MYFLNQGDELVFQIQNDNPNPEQQTIQQDLVMNQASSRGGNKRHGKEVLSIGEDIKDDERSKKIMHRDIEKQRRQEMSKLHGSLRSLLPLEFIKGKRSISDQMEQAVNYINHLQEDIRELNVKKDNLVKSSKKVLIAPGSDTSNLCLIDDDNDINVTVTPSFCGVEIIITSNGSMEENLSLSRVMQVLIQEGQLNVTSCASTRVNDRLVHTIRAEENNPTSINISELQQKLCYVIRG